MENRKRQGFKKGDTFTTSQVAAECEIHPNTVRQYEELGFIPPVPRAKNGYRVFSRLHLEHVRMVKMAFSSTWLGGAIRNKALSVLKLSASGSFDQAVERALEHLILVQKEREKAEIAAEILEAWAVNNYERIELPGQYLKTNKAEGLLDITLDALRSWERNGLINVPRDPENGYRIFGRDELHRLYVIRALRKARFSLMSIHHMFRQYDRGVRKGLTGILDQLPPEEEDIVFNTNRWLTKIKKIEKAAGELIECLERIINYH